MVECLACGNIPLSASHGLGEIKKINRIVGNSYSVFFFSLILVFALGAISYSYLKKVFMEIKDYRDIVFDLEKQKENEDYFYDEDLDVMMDMRKFMPKEQRKYLHKINNIYDEYNLLKSEYIQSSRGKANDDIIDKNIIYKKHDNYDYGKKDEV